MPREGKWSGPTTGPTTYALGLISRRAACCYYMPNTLLGVAVRVLEDAGSTPALKTAAAETLFVSLEQGVPIPTKAPKLLWAWLKISPASRSWRSMEKLVFRGIDQEEVRADALRLLDLDDAGDDLRDLAVDVLRGHDHAVHLNDTVLMGLLERASSDARVQQLGRLLHAVHTARCLPRGLLEAVRDRWAGSQSPAIREVAIELTAELPEADIEFIARMLEDPNADVRTSMSNHIDVHASDSGLTLGLVEARLRVEGHPHVRAGLLRAQASLLEEPGGLGRRRRR